MTWEVFLSEKTQQDLDGFPAKIVEQILTNCRRLAQDPIPDGKRIKKLKGFRAPLYRLRAGDYRVVFQRKGARIDIVRVLSKGDFQRVY